MPRKSLRKSLALGAGALGLAAFGPAATYGPIHATAPPDDPLPQRPNIIIILADDLGFSDIGPYGGEIRTPNLNRLAKQGVKFTQFYNTARCCPSRACLLTGLYPHQANMGHMTGGEGPAYGEPYSGRLSHNAVTIPEVLRTAGYDTYMAGKWHVDPNVQPGPPDPNWPLQRGFERYYGILSGASSYYDPATLTRDNTAISPFADPEYKPKGQYYLTDAFGDHAVRFIDDHAKAHKDRPFFMYVAFTAPHWPMQAPAETVAHYKGRYDQGYDPIRKARFQRQVASGLIEKDWPLNPTVGDWKAMPNKEWNARCMEVYAAMVERLDTNIGHITDALKRDGMLDNTLILFMADNGGCAESHLRKPDPRARPDRVFKAQTPEFLKMNIAPIQTRDGRPVMRGTDVMPGPDNSYINYGRNWANVSNTPFKEYKHYVHEGGIATPLIAFWPKGIRRGNVWERQPAHLIDLMATCVDLSGARYPAEYAGHKIKPTEGTSLAPAFLGRPLGRKAPIFWEHEGNRAMRDGNWKLVATGIDGPWELYDMSKDRTETNDLAAKNPERVKAMDAAYTVWANRVGAFPSPYRERRQETDPSGM